MLASGIAPGGFAYVPVTVVEDGEPMPLESPLAQPLPHGDRAIHLEWRETGPEGPLHAAIWHIRDLSVHNEADHPAGPTAG